MHLFFKSVFLCLLNQSPAAKKSKIQIPHALAVSVTKRLWVRSQPVCLKAIILRRVAYVLTNWVDRLNRQTDFRTMQRQRCIASKRSCR
jgi:hypothetical protein